MIVKSAGIVLHAFDFKESSLIAHVYTREYGRLSLMANGVRKRRPAFHRSLFQPLSLVDLDFYMNEKHEIQRIKDIRFEHAFNEIPYQIEKSTIAMFLAEVLYKVIKEQEPSHPLFSFLQHGIEILDNLEGGISNFHLLFLIQLSRYIGFFPENNFSDVNKYFNLQKGRYYPIDSNDKLSFNTEVSKKWHEASTLPLNEALGLKVNNEERTILLKGVVDYYSLHFGHLGEIKSYAVLHQVFS
ncbi:MAG: DNA repair protein RecO [Bacteroidota bacterium]